MSLKITSETARANSITLIEHIYNPNISYISGPMPYKENGEIGYTHANPPQKPQPNSVPWPYSPHVQLTIRFKDHVYNGNGALVGPYHVLTSANLIYDSKESSWADEITLTNFHGTCQVVKTYTFTQSEQKNSRYHIALLILSKSIGKQTGWSGLLAAPDVHLQQEKIQFSGYSSEHILQKIEPDRLHYTPALLDPQPGSALWVNGWKSSMIIGLETQDKDQMSFALRLTKQKIEALSQKIAENFKKFPRVAFGKAQWVQYFGDVGIEPPLPPDIHDILNAPCPIWKGKKLYETHLLTLIPQTVNGRPLTLKSLGELVQKPLQGLATKYRGLYRGDYKDSPAPQSHWTLLSQGVIPNSRNKSYADQQRLVSRYLGYEVPHILDATVAIFMGHVQSGTRLYSESPLTYTRCQEKYNANYQLVVGGFALGGLSVDAGYGDDDREYRGVGVQRKFS